MTAAAIAAALACCLAASPGCLAGADNDGKGGPGSEFPLRDLSSHHHQLAVSSQQPEERRNDEGSYRSWSPVSTAADADRSSDRSPDRYLRNKREDRSSDRYLREKREAGPGVSGQAVDRRSTAADLSSDRSSDRSLREKREAGPGVSGQSADRRILSGDEHLLAPQDNVRSFAHVAERGGLEFPSLEESTVMFMHIFKCAGSTIRRMMVAWAEAEGQPGALVASCDDARQEEKICLRNYRLLDEPVQSEIVFRQKVLAGHFLWGFQQYVRRPYLMITTLRNPLEVFVSAHQYTHKKRTKTLDTARDFISKVMIEALEEHEAEPSQRENGAYKHSQPQIGGFIFRLVGKPKTSLQGELLEAAADEAIRNLDRFWVVGVVEQYAGFQGVLKALLDPSNKYGDVWGMYSAHHFNTSPVESRDVLAAMDTELVQRFNGSLALQWDVYERGVALWGDRCQEVLPTATHQEMCTVVSPPSTYS